MQCVDIHPTIKLKAAWVGSHTVFSPATDLLSLSKVVCIEWFQATLFTHLPGLQIIFYFSWELETMAFCPHSGQPNAQHKPASRI